MEKEPIQQAKSESDQFFDISKGKIILPKFIEWTGITNKTEKSGSLSIARKLNSHQKAELIWFLYQNIRKEFSSSYLGKSALSQKNKREQIIENNPILASRINLLNSLISEPVAISRFEEEFERHREQKMSLRTKESEIKAVDDSIINLENIHDKIASDLFASRGKDPDYLSVLMFRDIKDELNKKRQERVDILRDNPRLAALAEHRKLVEYKRNLDETGFVWTKSRREVLEIIEDKLLSGRPIMLLSETGAGKTALVEALAKKLTGEPLARSAGGVNQRAQDLFATRAIDKEGSYWEYQKILQALSGKQSNRDSARSHQGQIFFDDEFNTRSTATQMEIIKSFSMGISPYKIFQPPNIAVYEPIAPKFAYIAAGNPPTEKYDRVAVDVAVEREFAGNIIEIDYLEQTKENPELFQIMLATLLDENSRLQVSGEEVAPAFIKEISNGEYVVDNNPKSGGFLWRFANCWSQMYKSFSYKPNVLALANESLPPEDFYLRKIVLDLGVVIGWLKTYKASEAGSSLENFMKKKIQEFLKQPNFSKEDKELTVKFLNYFGIDPNRRVSHSPYFSVMTPEEIGFLNPNIPRQKEDGANIPNPKEKVFVTPDGKEVFYLENLSPKIAEDYHVGQILRSTENNKLYRICGTRADTNEIFLLEVE